MSEGTRGHARRGLRGGASGAGSSAGRGGGVPTSPCRSAAARARMAPARGARQHPSSETGHRYARRVVTGPLVPTLEGTLVSVGTWLERQVELLIEAHRDGERVAAELLRGTGVLPGTDEELLAARLGPETAREAIARDHGYANWTDATAHADEPVDTRFEA